MTVANNSQYHVVFDDEFNSLNLRTASNPNGMWNTSFWNGGHTLATNGEQEYYVTPDSGLPVDPFSVQNGILTITAQPSPAGWGQQLDQLPYTSGLLTTDGTFAQTYGYFEMRAELPAGKGLWPAFWLLPSDHSWPPEIDIAEVTGQNPGLLSTVIHSSVAGEGAATTVPDTSGGYHTYGVDWEPDTITFYVDGQQVFQAPTPADMHKPMYMLVDLAIGAPPSGPDSSTPFPAQMNIDYIRAYASPNTIPLDPAAGEWQASATPVRVISGTTTPGVLMGDSLADQFYSPSGADTFVGGSGDDTFDISSNETIVLPAQHGIDTVEYWGPSSGYTLPAGIQNLVMEVAGPAIGNSLDNRIVASPWGNVLDGGGGNDLLVGGTGNDTFVVHSGQGSDTVQNFHQGDKIQFVGASANFLSFKASAVQHGPDVVFDLGGGQQLTLQNTATSSLSDGDFVLASS